MEKILKAKNERLQSLYEGDVYFTPHVNKEGFAYNCELIKGVKVSATRVKSEGIEDEALKMIKDPNIVGITNTGYVVYWE